MIRFRRADERDLAVSVLTAALLSMGSTEKNFVLFGSASLILIFLNSRLHAVMVQGSDRTHICLLAEVDKGVLLGVATILASSQ